MTDQQILEHIKFHRYPAALDGLYSGLPAVKKYITANSGSADDAQDMFQDALVILCRKVNAQDFVLTAPLKTYLFSIVKNCWLQQLKQRRNAALITELPANDESEEAAFMLAQAAFNSLGEKCRSLLTMFYFEKKSYQAIAETLGFGDDKTAKNQKYRCLQKAKESYFNLSKQQIV